jgi:hypothetical protein
MGTEKWIDAAREPPITVQRLRLIEMLPPQTRRTSLNADDIFKMAQPFITALIGGGMTLLATFIAFRRTSKAAAEAERLKFSHESAREITTQLAAAAGIARQHGDPKSLDLTNEGRAQITDGIAAMAHHAGYIDDTILQASVDEATDFLRPPPRFEIYLARPVASIIADLKRWAGPMVQAHILDQPIPEEPDFLVLPEPKQA